MRWCLLVVVFLAVGCDGAVNTAREEQNRTEANQSRLLKAQPPATLDWSLERENINKRITLWNDPNKVSFIYLVNFGKVMAFYTIKGKVSSVNSQITNTEQLASAKNNSDMVGPEWYHVMPSPAEDGSYGTNGDAIFFFTTDGTYVEWAGDYMLADKPLKLSTPPTLTLEIKDE